MVLDQFEQDFQHSLEQRHILALFHDKRAELNVMEEVVPQVQVFAEGLRHEVCARIAY